MTEEIDVNIISSEEAGMPWYGSEHAAGADISAYLPEGIVVIQPGTSALIPTGIQFAIPEGYEMQVRPRSGLALRNQITVLNTPGTIDSDYRGEVKIILINHGSKPFEVEHGMRIAQIIIAPVVRARFLSAESLAFTARGDGGFGHTGV